VREFEQMVRQCVSIMRKQKYFGGGENRKRKIWRQIAKTMAEMVKIPGVGRKSRMYFGKRVRRCGGIAVDTHVIGCRACSVKQREDAEKIEQDLMQSSAQGWFAAHICSSIMAVVLRGTAHKHELCPLTKVIDY